MLDDVHEKDRVEPTLELKGLEQTVDEADTVAHAPSGVLDELFGRVDHRQVVERLREQLDQFMARATTVRKNTVLSDDDRALLESLGYVQ